MKTTKENTVQLDSFCVIGIEARTTNHDEMAGSGKIPALWQRFFAENIASKITNQTKPGCIIAAYTDIDTDENGPYSIVIGVEVKPGTPVPEGMRSLEIGAGPYNKFTTSRGSLETIGIEAWQRIWQDKTLKKKRRYVADFESYDGRAQDPSNAEFDIFIGVSE